MKYVDIHCHLDSEDYDSDREEVLARMEKEGVGTITIGTDLESSKRAVEIARINARIYACIGVHPVRDEETENISNGTGPDEFSKTQGEKGLALGFSEKEFEEGPDGVPSPDQGEGHAERGVGFNEVKFEKLIANPKVIAIGECGLDYFAPRSSSGAKSEVGFSVKQTQKKLFEQQIKFALKHDKPLMLHIRDDHQNFSSKNLGGQAYEDVLNILESYKKAEGGEKLRGNVHFFAGSKEIAKRFLDLGFTMSFTGVVTFTHDYDEVIKFLPKEAIMSETDAPFVAPVPYRGKRNEPTYVIEVVKKLAEIRGEDVATLNTQIIENFKRVFSA